MKTRRSRATHTPADSLPVRRRAAGFTLIELSVVTVILALMVSVAVVSLRPPYQAARLEDTIGRIAFFDRQLRRHAGRSGRALLLRIDVDRSTLDVRDASGGPGEFSPLVVGSGARIDRVALFPGRIGRRTAAVPITRGGRSPTYALRIQPADGDGQWLLFAGLTGQMTRIEDDERIKQLLRSVTRPDAP